MIIDYYELQIKGQVLKKWEFSHYLLTPHVDGKSGPQKSTTHGDVGLVLKFKQTTDKKHAMVWSKSPEAKRL